MHNSNLNGEAMVNGHSRLPQVLPVDRNAGVAPSATVDNGTPPPEGRDSSGRFTRGNRLGKGNPHYRRLCELRQAVLDVIGPEQVRELFRSLLERAKAGDNEAARLLLLYAVGKPAPAPDPDKADLHESALTASVPDRAEVLAAMLDGLAPAAAAALVRDILPADPTAVGRKVIGSLSDIDEDADPEEVEFPGDAHTARELTIRRETRARQRRAEK